MEEALFLKHGHAILFGDNEAKDIMITRKGDIEDAFANAYRAQVIAE
jgi:hypothetical protein